MMRSSALVPLCLPFLLLDCAPPPGRKAAVAPDPQPITIIGAAPFMPGGAAGGKSLAETAAESVPAAVGYRFEAVEDAAAFARLCPADAAADRVDLAFTTRHPTPDETAICAGRGIALTSVKLLGDVDERRPELATGTFLVYDAADPRPETLKLVHHLTENRVALENVPGYSGSNRRKG